MISKEVEARILRLFDVEHWKVGTIAGELGIHHSVVTRVLQQAGRLREVETRPSRLLPFIAFILDAIARYPKITASRLFGMVRERGYQGGPDHFRHEIGRLRPRPAPEPFLRIKTLAGEEGQVDWGYFGKLQIGKAVRQLMAFVMVLSFSRRLFFRFFPGQTTTHFLRGHVAALEAFGGCPRRILYDNLKSAVLERRGDAIHFHPDMLGLSVHYRTEPRPVAPCRGNEKGRVERAIRYVRTSFFEAREWRTLDELNDMAEAFCNGPAMERKWPEDPSRTVADAFAEEKGTLLPLPPTHYPAFERVETIARKTPYLRFDLNDYSVPHDRIGRLLVIVATMETVRILDGLEVVAEHRRSFDRGAVIEDRRHIEAILLLKRKARKGFGLDRLSRVAPESATLFSKLAERGQNIGSAVSILLKLLDTYGPDDFRFGIHEALRREVFHPHAVRQAIERRRGEAGQGPVLPIPLPNDPRITGLSVTPHDLSDYDRKEMTDGNQPEGESEEGPVEAGAGS